MASQIKRKILKNGVTVIFKQRKNKVVSVAFAVRFGGINETTSNKGIAHFIEHMLYKGTPTRNAQQISTEIEKNGGELNGFTSEQITAFWCKMPSRHVDVALNVLSDMVKNPLFDKTTGEITQMRTGFVFDGQPHATYYFIYRQPAPAISTFNINADTQWNSTCCYDRYCTINSKTSFLDTFYTDIKTNFTTGQKWVYRARTGDTINKVAGDTTASAQSSLCDSTTAQTFSISSDSVIHFGATNFFKKGNYVVINGTTSSNGYYYVKDTGDTSIWITPAIGSNTGTVYLTNSIVTV